MATTCYCDRDLWRELAEAEAARGEYSRRGVRPSEQLLARIVELREALGVARNGWPAVGSRWSMEPDGSNRARRFEVVR